MSSAMLACEAPSVPEGRVHADPLTEDPERIAAFVIELSALLDLERFERARARAAARRVAARKGLDALWSEVLAIEMARASGGRQALADLGALASDRTVGEESFQDALDEAEAGEGTAEALAALARRFKLAAVSPFSQRETLRLLHVLGIDDLFDAVVTAPDGAAEVAAPLGEPASACVWVFRADSPGLPAAHEQGLRTVALVPGAPGVTWSPNADLAVGSFTLVAALAAGVEAPCASIRNAEPRRSPSP